MFLGRREGGEEKRCLVRYRVSLVRIGRRRLLGYILTPFVRSWLRGPDRKSRKNSGYGVGEKEVAAVDVALLAEGRGMED